MYPSECILFFNHPATTEIYSLSLPFALPISNNSTRPVAFCGTKCTASASLFVATRSVRFFSERKTTKRWGSMLHWVATKRDRKSTRLNSSHSQISYAVFCLKKKKTQLPVNLE